MSISQRLCGICAFPALDGGVPVDGEKLAEWSRCILGIEIEQISNAARPIVCQFCIWEARLDHENSIDDRSDNKCEYDWWTGNDNDQNYEKYFYKKSIIQPCRVELKRLSRDVDHTLDMHRTEKDSHKFSSCKAEREMQQNDSIVNSVLDLKYDMVKCIYCATLSEGVEQMNKHIKLQHKDAIECEFSSMCHNFFLTKYEMKKHVIQVHTPGIRGEAACIYCGNVFRNKSALVMHIKKVHAAISIKCTLSGCTYYFLSQAESDEHFSKLHQQEKSFKEYQCPKCSYKTCIKKYWKDHFKRRHGAVEEVKCQKCEKDFKNEFYLKQHLRVHQLRCTCEHCGKTMLKSSLRIHFARDLCTKVPISSSSLLKSAAVKCEYDSRCPKLFRTIISMKRHASLAHAGKKTNVPCIYCGKVYLHENTLYAHIRNAHATISFKCRFFGCRHFFLNKSEYDEHFSKEHQLEEGLKKFQCQKCSYKSCDNNNLKKHFQRMHCTVERVECQKCGKKFKHETDLKHHFKTIHHLRCTCDHCGKTMQKSSLHKHFSENLCKKVASLDCRPKVFKCEYDARCTKIFCSSLSMKRHIINIHKEIRKNVPCIYCGKVNSNEYRLASHIHNAHAEISFKCRFHGCKTYFLSQLESDEHFIKEHQLEDSLKKFQCPKCTYKTSIKRYLQLHLQKKHDAVKKVKFHEKCRKCGKELKNKSTLKHHIRTTHKLRCTCEHCGKTMQKDSLRKHFLEDLCRKGPNSTATLLKSAIFKCEYDARCTKRFRSEHSMKIHVIRAHKEKRKNSPCIYCGKVSTNENSLASHIRNAHSAISFKCRLHGCKLYFLSQAESDEHFSKEHQLEESLKKFECPKCSYKTYFKCGLQTHLQMKHGVKKIKCQKCGKEFKTKESLKQHLNLVHYQERCVCEHCGATLKKSSLYHHLLGKRCKGGMFCNASQ